MEGVLHTPSLGSQCQGRGKEHTEKGGEIRWGWGRETTMTSRICCEAAVSNLAEPLGISNISVEIYTNALQFLMEFLQVKDSSYINIKHTLFRNCCHVAQQESDAGNLSGSAPWEERY